MTPAAVSETTDVLRRLRESELRFQRIFDSDLVGIHFWDTQGNVTEANDAYLTMVGYTRDDLASKRVRWRDLTPSEYAALDDSMMEQMKATGSCASFEKEYIRKDGRRIPVLVHAALLPDSQHEGIAFAIDLSSLRQAERELRRQRQEQEIILDSVPAMIWYKDRSNRILRVNKAGAAAAGLSKSQIEGRSTYDLYPEHAADYHSADLEVIVSGKPKMGIIEQIALGDGTKHWIRTDKIPYRDEFGEIVGVIVFATDINELKQAEEKLRESESLFRTLAEHSSVGFWRITRDGYTMYINPALCRMLEIDDPAELNGRTYHEFFTPQSLAAMKQEHSKRSSGIASTYEVETIGKRCGRRNVLISGSPLMNPDGTLGTLVGTFTDITHLKQAQELLRREQQLMQIIMDNMPDAIYLKDRESRFLRTNQAHASIMRLDSPQQAIGKTDASFFPAGDAAKFMADERDVIERGQPLVNCIEHHGGATGEMRWWSTTKVPVRDSSGQVIGLAGITRDITPLKIVEEALRHEQQLTQLLLDHTPDAIYFKDRQGRFLRVNPAQARYLGLARPEDAIGRTDPEFFPSQAAAGYFADERAVIATGEPLLARIEHNGRSGDQLRWFSTTKVPIRDSGGSIVGTAGISHEITKIKQTEEEIRKLNEDLEQRVIDRTAKLEAANQRLEREIAERRQAQEKVSRYQARLRSLASELSLAEERERRRIAVDLHDQIGQTLALIQIKLQELRETAKGRVAVSLDECVELIRKPIQDTRSLVFNLSPPVLYDLGFKAAAAWLVDQHQGQAGLRISFEDDGRAVSLPEAVAVLLFRAIRELLTNVVKHSGATAATVWLRSDRDSLRVGVEDNGCGFDPAVLGGHADSNRGFGLFSIREQLDRVGGALAIQSSSGSGCLIILTVPHVESKS